MIFIAKEHQRGKRTSLKEIAANTHTPLAFSAKVLQVLTRQKLLTSSRGVGGGFALTSAPQEINLAAIVTALDGDKIFTSCGLGLPKCNAEKPCPAHPKFFLVREALAQMLHTTYLHELALEIESGRSHLSR